MFLLFGAGFRASQHLNGLMVIQGLKSPPSLPLPLPYPPFPLVLPAYFRAQLPRESNYNDQ